MVRLLEHTAARHTEHLDRFLIFDLFQLSFLCFLCERVTLARALKASQGTLVATPPTACLVLDRRLAA